MTGIARWLSAWDEWLPRLLRAPARGAAEHRRGLEQALHDDVAIGMAALTLKLDLIATSTVDPATGAEIDATRVALCRIIDDLRKVGTSIYPPVLVSAGLKPALGSVAESLDLRLRLDLPARDLGEDAKSRTGLLVADHLHTLCPGTFVTVRVRGRRFVRVRITAERPGEPGRHTHRAVLRCE
nr:hypothetical protein [Kibdelosporangium sp. MJ126-NF4]CEL15637.1 putative two-component system sensor kinase [Kibdelosporangium sp. MJ126-NF4]CTQ90324.1 putative two-component system sensor kinase [Kibdelosporangium sp. MJ126-NF4]